MRRCDVAGCLREADEVLDDGVVCDRCLSAAVEVLDMAAGSGRSDEADEDALDDEHTETWERVDDPDPVVGSLRL